MPCERPNSNHNPYTHYYTPCTSLKLPCLLRTLRLLAFLTVLILLVALYLMRNFHLIGNNHAICRTIISRPHRINLHVSQLGLTYYTFFAFVECQVGCYGARRGRTSSTFTLVGCVAAAAAADCSESRWYWVRCLVR